MNGPISNTTWANRWEHLSISIDKNGFESTEIWNSDAKDFRSGTWNRGYAYIGRVKDKFSLTYTAMDRSPTDAPSTFGYVALTGLKMNGCSTNFTQSSVCNGFRCGNGRRISKYNLCDYGDDCGDGSDETYQLCYNYKLRCDFENGMCDWGRYRKDSWWVTIGYSRLTSGPTRDHTKGSKILSRTYIKVMICNIKHVQWNF